jgi:hypothetical protein
LKFWTLGDVIAPAAITACVFSAVVVKIALNAVEID